MSILKQPTIGFGIQIKYQPKSCKIILIPLRISINKVKGNIAC